MRAYREKLSNDQREQIHKYDKQRYASKKLKLSTEKAVKKHNDARRQEKCRANRAVPSSVRKFKKLVDHVCLAANGSPIKSRYLKTALQKKCSNGVEFKAGPVLQLRSFKSQNRVREHKNLVDKLVEEHGSRRQAAENLKVHWPTFQQLCKIPEKKEKKDKPTWKVVRDFFSDNSKPLPNKKDTGKRYLQRTLQENHNVYKVYCEKKKIHAVSFATFCRLRPKNVYTANKTPDRQCICDQCENFRLDRQAAALYNIKGLESCTADCIRQSLCKVCDKDSNADSNPLDQVDPAYGYLNCITRNCEHCGPEFVVMEIIKQNADLHDPEKRVTWKRWEWVQKPGTKFRRLEKITHEGTKADLVKQYAADLKGMAFHLFSCNWNYAQFIHCRDNLKPGQLLQVLDFGQNYMNVFQDEPQAVHWDHTQTVIHPIVNYYIGANGELVTEEHVMISSDLKHDKFAVRRFEEESLKRLKAKGFVPERIFQFCDNCAGQYKSKGPFQFISKAGIPTIRMFFGARHGKGPADGVVGRVKMMVTRAVKCREVVIRNAEEFADFCKLKLANNSFDVDREYIQNFIQEIFYIDDIERDDDEILAVTTPNTRSYYGVRSTGNFMVLEVREVACCCESCLYDDGSQCPSQAYASKWKAVNLHTGKPLLDDAFENLHWGTSLNTDQTRCKRRSRKSGKVPKTKKPSNATKSQDGPDHAGSNARSVDDPVHADGDAQDNFDWKKVLEDVQKMDSYHDMEEYITDIVDEHRLDGHIQSFKKHFVIDNVALNEMPRDSPKNVFPVTTVGDGNCFPRSISRAIFGTEDHHKEIRTRLLVELVKHKRLYLSEEFLSNGTSFRTDSTFAEMYATFSGQHLKMTRGNVEEIIEKIFQNEMLALRWPGTFMGMWQVWAASSVISRPIRSVFPERGREIFRGNFNRRVVPIDITKRRRDALNIMWTPCVPHGEVQHFVPLLRK